MKTYNIAVIPGDGIGMEVMPEGIKAIQAASQVVGGFDFRFEEFPCRDQKIGISGHGKSE